jgi:hypothetical protein
LDPHLERGAVNLEWVAERAERFLPNAKAPGRLGVVLLRGQPWEHHRPDVVKLDADTIMYE